MQFLLMGLKMTLDYYLTKQKAKKRKNERKYKRKTQPQK